MHVKVFKSIFFFYILLDTKYSRCGYISKSQNNRSFTGRNSMDSRKYKVTFTPFNNSSCFT